MNTCGKDIQTRGRLLRIARLADEMYDFLDDPPAAVEALKQSGERVDLFTFTQCLPDITPRYAYPLEWDNLAALRVTNFDHWWTRQINGKTRNMVRRAETKGVVIREVPFDERLVEHIHAVYNECPNRQGRPFWHYGKPIDAVHRENATFLDRSIFLAAMCGDTLIGFAKLVIDEHGRQAALMQILSLISQRDLAPTNALIAQAVRACATREIPYLVYSHFTYGQKERDGLSDFKLHNGFERIELPRYYVPLSAVGRLAMHLGLHHRLTDRVPEAVLVRLRKVRSQFSYSMPRRIPHF